MATFFSSEQLVDSIYSSDYGNANQFSYSVPVGFYAELRVYHKNAASWIFERIERPQEGGTFNITITDKAPSNSNFDLYQLVEGDVVRLQTLGSSSGWKILILVYKQP